MNNITNDKSYLAGLGFGLLARQLYSTGKPLQSKASAAIGREFSRRTAHHSDLMKWVPELIEKLTYHDEAKFIRAGEIHQTITKIADLHGEYHSDDFRYGFFESYNKPFEKSE